MTVSPINESTIELAALEWFSAIGFQTASGPDIAPEGSAAERESFTDVLLLGRLTTAIQKLNPGIPTDGLDEAFRKITRLDGPTLIGRNRQFHNWLRDGVEVEFRRLDGSVGGDRVRLVDYDNPANNDLLAVNQFVVREGSHTRSPDIVVFVNGLPLAVIELKNMADEAATIDNAFQQLGQRRGERQRRHCCQYPKVELETRGIRCLIHC